MFGSMGYFLAHPKIAQEEPNGRVISGLFANSPPQKTIPSKGIVFGAISCGAHLFSHSLS